MRARPPRPGSLFNSARALPPGPPPTGRIRRAGQWPTEDCNTLVQICMPAAHGASVSGKQQLTAARTVRSRRAPNLRGLWPPEDEGGSQALTKTPGGLCVANFLPSHTCGNRGREQRAQRERGSARAACVSLDDRLSALHQSKGRDHHLTNVPPRIRRGERRPLQDAGARQPSRLSHTRASASVAW